VDERFVAGKGHISVIRDVGMSKGYMGTTTYKTNAFDDEMKSWFNVCYIDGRILEDGEYVLTLYPFIGDKLRLYGK
jgi:hypothetical protein